MQLNTSLANVQIIDADMGTFGGLTGLCAILSGKAPPGFIHLDDGAIVVKHGKLPDMAIYALYPSRKHLSPAVRALLDFLVERFAKVPWS